MDFPLLHYIVLGCTSIGNEKISFHERKVSKSRSCCLQTHRERVITLYVPLSTGKMVKDNTLTNLSDAAKKKFILRKSNQGEGEAEDN